MIKIKPSFIVIGAGKSGTTSLCNLLSKHPQICMSTPKEPRFFSLDENFERGWQWYECFFPDAHKAVAIGEGSANYTMRTAYPKTASRIAEALPKVKLIYMVRHPLERIESNWRMGAWENPNYPSFNKALRDPSQMPALVDRSKYWFQINAYRDYFPDDQILVLFLDDFKRDLNGVLNKCYEFIGVDPELPTNQIRDTDKFCNTSAQRNKPSPLLTQLRQIPMVKQVGQILPKSFRAEIKNSLTNKSPEPPQWQLDNRKWAIEQLIEDTHSFLKFYNKPIDFWQFHN